MATQTTGGGSTTSFTNTPQAKDDNYAYLEDVLRSDASLYNIATNTITLDVMANDLGGNAKSLFSVDDGDGNALTADYDLIQKDVNAAGVSPWELTFGGNWVRINNGKIEYRISDGSGIVGQGRSVDSLNAGEVFSDQFVYAIRLGNGTLSEATVKINITGANDNASIAVVGPSDNSVTEAGGVANAIPGDPNACGTLLVNDADLGQNTFQTPLEASLNGTYGTFTFNTMTGQWTYMLNNNDPDTQALAQGAAATDTLTVKSLDGTASYNIVVNITGTNDAPVVSGAVTGSATEDGAGSSLNALANASDVDAGTTLSVVNVPASLPAGVTYNAATHSFTLDPANAAYQHLAAGQTTTVTVSYGVTDGTATTPASVSWTVTGTNDAPVVSGAVLGSATEDGLSSSLNALANASDVDDGTTLSVVNVPAVLPPGVTYNAATHSFTLDPANAAYQHLAAGQTT
ncbi:MAG: VCBS domain-containing protein, partial [Sphingomicrobium sp.]